MIDAPKNVEHLSAIKDYILIFSANHCGPCKPAKRIINEVSYESGVIAYLIDVDERPHDAAAYGISSLPTVFVYRGGELVGSFIGSVKKAELEGLLN